MKAAVCFKVIKELEKVLPSDWQSFDTAPDTSYVGTVMGCYDEAALEIALKLKDMDANTMLSALTFGDLPSNHARRLFAAGFNNVVCLRADKTEFSPMETALRLASWLRNNPQDLILCGSRTAVNDSGSVPYYLAAELNIPIVPGVIAVKAAEQGISIIHKVSGGYCESEIRLPVLLAAGSSTDTLRLTSLTAQIQAKKKQAEIIDADNVSAVKIEFIPGKETACHYPKLSPEAAAEWLTGLIKEAAE